MDDDDIQDGPFTVWQMFNTPTLNLFNHLDKAADEVERLLNSIMKLSGDFAEILVPRAGSTQLPESSYSAFNTWLLGRLFYLWSVDSLQRIHVASKHAQIRILNILCVNDASFYKKIHTEYVYLLNKLIEYYKNNVNSAKHERLLLENFIPDHLKLYNGPVTIDLQPIYVEVKDMKTCTTLIGLILELLSQTIPTDSDQYDREKVELEELFQKVLNMIENFSADLKLKSLTFFVHLIEYNDSISIRKFEASFPTIYESLLSYFEDFVKLLMICHESGEINVSLENFNMIALKLLNIIISSKQKDYNEMLTTICSVILSCGNNMIFSKDLKLKCLSLSSQLSFTQQIIDIQNKSADEIEMLEECYSKNILTEWIDLDKKDVLLKLRENFYYKQVLSLINSMTSCEDMNIDSFLLEYDMKRYSAALKILQRVLLKARCHSDKILQSVCSKKIISKNETMFILKTLFKIIELYKNVIINNLACIESINEMVLNTIILDNNITKEDSDTICKIICIQNTLDFPGVQLKYNESANIVILKYLLMVKYVLKNVKLSSHWDSIIKLLINTFMQNKSSPQYTQLMSLTPLMLINRIFSASKIIGDILMPTFLMKNVDKQNEITMILPVLTCMSIPGTESKDTGNGWILIPDPTDYQILLTTPNKKSIVHTLFKNRSIHIGVLCSKCHKHVKLTKNYTNHMEICTETIDISIETLEGLKKLFLKFLYIKQYTDISKSGYWKVFTILCNHFFVFQYGFSIDLMDTDDYGNCENILYALKPYIDHKVVVEDKDDMLCHREKAFSICVNMLVKCTQKSLESNIYEYQTTTIDMIKEFGVCNNEKTILSATKLFVYFIMQPNCTLAPKAMLYLREVCEHYGYTSNQCYHRFKKDFCKLFVVCILNCGDDFVTYLLKAVTAFEFVCCTDFISKEVQHVLPYLVPYSVEIKEIPDIVEEIASLVQCSSLDLLIERFPYIYVHIYLNESNHVANSCYNTIEKLTQTSISYLIKKHFRVILTEFLLQYSCNRDKVLNACKYLACNDPEATTPNSSTKMSVAQIADFLNPRFLGVLACFDLKLVSNKVALSVKRKALRSFSGIMQLMGVKYITPLRFKVLATLRSALPLTEELPNFLANAWAAFVYNIDINSLGPLLPSVVESLLQMGKCDSLDIQEIYGYIFKANGNLLSTHLSSITFLEVEPNFEAYKKYINLVKRSLPIKFVEKVKWYLQMLSRDISKIKLYALRHLDKLLKENRAEVHKAIFGGKNIDPVIVELIYSLISGCKHSDLEVSLSSGKCLGQLGAVEAEHLPRQYIQTDKSTFAFSIEENCFAVTALMELSRAFQYSKDTMIMDCYALTIQEMIKFYEISPTGSNKDVWNSLSEQMHQIMTPLLTSRYTLAYPLQPKKIHPLYGSMYATTFLEWVYNWAGQLIPMIESEKNRNLLRTVHPSMRRDVRTLFLFLPYVLLHAIISKNNIQNIQEEMLAVIGLDNFNNETTAACTQSKYKMLRHAWLVPNIKLSQTEEGNQTKCSKAVYSLLDFLNRWLLEWCHTKQNPLEDENYKTISSFLSKFDKLTIARGNFMCGELERALQYLEIYMQENKQRFQEQLSFLAEIYAMLDEPDSVAGILRIKRTEPSLKELILAQVVTGRMQDAALCYERLAREGHIDRPTLMGMVDCYLSLDQPFTALRLLSEQEDDLEMSELGAEALWRLGRFEQLEELTRKPVPSSRDNWGLIMGRTLLAFRKQDHDAFQIARDDAVTKLLAQMDSELKGENALRSGYQNVLGLHIITEADHAEHLLQRLKSIGDSNKELTASVLGKLMDDWRRRLALVESDVRTIEPLLRTRRILLQQTQELLEPTHPITASSLKSYIGDLWLESAKHARKADIFQQAYIYILNAEDYTPEELFIEKAKMYWARGQHEHAFTTLRRTLQDAFPQVDKLTYQQKKIYAKAKLLIAKYSDEDTKVDVDVNIGYFKEAVDLFPKWEKSLVCLGAYFEKVSTKEACPNMSAMWSRRISALNSYGKALQFGHKYLYQSMPRMLSIWLDVEVTASDTTVYPVLAEMTESIKIYSERLPLYLYLTAFSQIVSRICHPVLEVYQQLKAIIVKLMLAYPQHTLWMMMSVMKSSYPQRLKRCSDVLSDPRLKEPNMLKLINDFTQLAEKLIELCNKPIAGNIMSTNVSSLVRTLPRLLASDNFSHIMMPYQEFCKIVLPSKAARQECLDVSIPNEPPVYIAGIVEHITILPSLQKPRKVTLKGSNGKCYIVILKPRDDLRKDYRLMEFNGVVNRFLQDAPETRRRRLYIRTYCVLPLNEECGLIEWVPNLVGLRPILLQIYKQKGILTTNRELKEMMCSNKDPVERKRKIYEEQLLPRHPPVFQEWFRRVFLDPYGWYQARSAYIRTTAVMSMVGYILGLGDRHGENISFDSTNGDTVHVDFNCLFNKGEEFDWPERVPFRLTHNMEAAMGPLKHEGMYRKCCEAVMVALRSQTAALMSVIGPFVYDPLVKWGRVRPMESGERTNEKALHHLQQIKQRLNGMVKTKNKQLSLSLSPEGQVEHLIVEATSVHNLCQMYIGWGPFL